MKYASTLLAVLFVTGLFGVPALFADGGGDYSEPPTVEEDTVILADGGGDRGGQPVDEQTEDIRMADGGGDRGGQPVEEGRDIALV
jgi:hypothetical protein